MNIRNYTFFIAAIFLVASCSNNDGEVEELVQEKVEMMAGHEVVRDLLIENDDDKEQLARIFKCPMATLDRVRNKETYLTENALKEFKNLLVNVKVYGDEAFQENDPYYDSWFRSFKLWLNDYILYGIIAFLVVMFFGATNFLVEGIDSDPDPIFQSIILIILLIFAGGYLITWLFNIIWPYENPVIIYSEKINPIFETLL